jgi:enamine deaminase RidA (YjgF/YER057c/UK114 family)
MYTYPEVKAMYDATLLEILPDYGSGGKQLTHAVMTDAGKVLRMSGFPAIGDRGDVGKGDIGPQTTQALELIKLTIERAGATWDDITHLTFYFADRLQFCEKGIPARWAFFKKHSKTVRSSSITSIGVKELMHPDYLIEIEAVAVWE